MRLLLGTLACCALLLAGPVAAQVTASVEGFYRAHPLTMVIGLPAGAAYDIYARTIGRHITRHIPGNPTFLPQNLPGAGSLQAANNLYNQAPKDGSTIATFVRSIPMQPLLDEQGVRFDALKLNWIGSPASEVSVVLSWHTTPFKTIRDVMEKEMVVGATALGADNAVFPNVLNSLFGTRFKIVTGYNGAGPILLAIERGELDGVGGTSWANIASGHPHWLAEKKINLLLQMSMQAREDIPAPLVTSLAQSESDRQVLALVFSGQVMGYPFAAPPGVPAERVAALREAFAATMRDPEFRADAQRQSLDIRPVTGEAMQALLERAYASPPEVVARARAALGSGGK